MRAHQIDKDGNIINTIEVKSLSDFPNLVDASIGGGKGDSIVNGVLVKAAPAPIPVPKAVTKAQFREALHRRDELTAIQDELDLMITEANADGSRNGGVIQIQWEDKTTIDRDWPFLLMLQARLFWTNEKVDDLFRYAATL